MFDVQKIRAQFPILSQSVNGKPLVYFDNDINDELNCYYFILTIVLGAKFITILIGIMIFKAFKNHKNLGNFKYF